MIPKEILPWVICRIFSIVIILTGYLVTTVTLIRSIFADYRLIITTNTHGECFFEIIVMVSGGILYVVTIIQLYRWEKMMKGGKNERC